MKKKTHQVLSILLENSKQPQPQLVPSAAIAGKMNIDLVELRQVLKSMQGIGVIETDPDQQYNLITPEGLQWLDQQGAVL